MFGNILLQSTYTYPLICLYYDKILSSPSWLSFLICTNFPSFLGETWCNLGENMKKIDFSLFSLLHSLLSIHLYMKNGYPYMYIFRLFRFIKTATNKMRCPIFCLSWTPDGRRLITGPNITSHIFTKPYYVYTLYIQISLFLG